MSVRVRRRALMKDKQTIGKLRLDLLPVQAIEGIAAAMQWGVDGEKYPEWGFLEVKDWESKYFAALQRHIFAWRKGETIDERSGLHPLFHAGACVLILIVRSTKDVSRR